MASFKPDNPEIRKTPSPQTMRADNFQPGVGFVGFDVGEIERSIPERFERIAHRFGDHGAIETKEKVLSYRQLNEAVNRVARAILRYRGKRSRPIAILVEHGAGGIIAMLAVLKAGGIYVPLDPAFPSTRLKYMLGDSKAALILTDHKSLRAAEALCMQNVRLLDMDDLDPDLSAENPGFCLAPGRLASILYTTGSTGQPKGVVQNHRNLLHLAMRYTKFYRVHDADRIALLRSLSVSGGTLHTLGALLNGATLMPFDLKHQGVANLAQWLRKSRITMCSLSPRILRDLSTIAGVEPFRNLRRVTFSGEPLYRGDIELCKKHFPPRCALINSLGATEAPMAAQFVIDANSIIEAHLIPVGFASTDVEILLRDEDGHPVREGEIAEITLKSRYLALGYWRSRELSRKKFLRGEAGEDRTYLTGDLGRYLPDGSLLHLGRKDDLVKIRGYRVGIIEIEMRLREHPEVKEAAVAAWDRESHDNFLAAYVVAEIGTEITAIGLAAFLRERLPDYMVPSAFVFLPSLPQINGKVDRLALPRPERIRPRLAARYREATNEIERQLIGIWQEMLDIRPIGTADNFFDLGGHSLAAMRVVSEVIKEFRLEISLQSLFQSPTIAEMVAVITRNQANVGEPRKIERLLNELEALSDDDARGVLESEPKLIPSKG